MEGEVNGTLHPSCGASEPPYSQELLQSLDLPGRFLFAILTLMTLIANLVFIEEAVYIYRKIPSSKRSIIIWVNAAAPVIATTSCTGMWIPRSTMFTDFTAAVFFAIVIHKFLMMMIKDCGGQKLLLKRFENGHFKISTGPCCCCCVCLPRVRITRFMAISCSILNGSLLSAEAALMAVLRAQGAIVKTNLPVWEIIHNSRLKREAAIGATACPLKTEGEFRRSLFWLKLGTLQFAFLRPVLMFLSIVLWSNGNYTLYNVSTKGAAIWISCVVGVLTIIALWPVAIMFQQVRTLLICKKIIPKFALYQFILILNHLQTSIINILATRRIIPCAPPLSSAARGAYMTQQLLIMEMFLITLISRVVYRRKYDDLEPPECKAEEAGDNKQTPKTILNGTVSEDGLPRV